MVKCVACKKFSKCERFIHEIVSAQRLKVSKIDVIYRNVFLNCKEKELE